MTAERKFAATFEDLEVFQIAFNASIQIHKVSLAFPKIEQFALADQIRRASKSVCANITEGFGRQRGSKAEFKRFLLIAIGSSDEVQLWIKYCEELDYITSAQAVEWRETYRRVSRMLQSLYSKQGSDNR